LRTSSNGRGGGTSCGQQIITDQNALAGFNRILMNFERVGAVLELVGNRSCLHGSFLGLRTGIKPAFKRYASAGAKINPRASTPTTASTAFSRIVFTKLVHKPVESGGILQQRRQIVEEDSGFG